uniref:Uncharacterized protein n=1 Tax=viral metagenome TaxID=1070528 RepID=A0A6M3J0B5_9ZZZZ
MLRKRIITTDEFGNIYVTDEMVTYDPHTIKEHLVANERLRSSPKIDYYLRNILK